MENGQKTLRPLEEGLRKPLPWPKKKKYDSHMKVDIIPQDTSCCFSVNKKYFLWYYRSNNEKITCTPRFVILVQTHVLQHFFDCSTANFQMKPKP